MPFLRDAISVLTTSVAVIPFGLLASIVLARWLSVEERGAYALASELALTAVVLAQLGWPQASIHSIRTGGMRPDEAVGAAFTVWVVISAAAMALCWAFEDLLLERVFVGTSRQLFTVAVAAIPFYLLGFFAGGIARGIDRFDLFNSYRLSVAILGSLALVVALLVLGMGPVGALSSQLLVYALLAVGLAWLVTRRVGVRIPAIGGLMKSLRFGAKTHVQSVLASIHERLDLFMLSYLMQDASAVAFYAVAVGVINRLRLVPDSIATSLLPALSELRDDDAIEFSAAAARHTLFSMVLTCVVVAPLAPFILPLVFGDPYAASVKCFLLLLPSMAGLGFYYVIARYFTSREKQFTNIAIQVTATVANISLNLLWIPLWGIVGAAAATLISYTLASILAVVAFVRSTEVGPRATLLLRAEDVERIRSRFRQARGR